MKIELDDYALAADLKPLLKAGWVPTLHFMHDRAYVMVRTPRGGLDRFMTIRSTLDACVYLGSPGDGVEFTGPTAIKDGVALALDNKERVVVNTHTGHRHRVSVRPGEDALDVYAREEGYDSWKEMRRYPSPLDLEQNWIVEEV